MAAAELSWYGCDMMGAAAERLPVQSGELDVPLKNSQSLLFRREMTSRRTRPRRMLPPLSQAPSFDMA